MHRSELRILYLATTSLLSVQYKIWQRSQYQDKHNYIIAEPICLHNFDSARVLNLIFSSTVWNPKDTWTSSPPHFKIPVKRQVMNGDFRFPELQNAVCTEHIGKVQKWKPIFSLHHRVPQVACTRHRISAQQKPAETACSQHPSSHLRNACVLPALITVVLMIQVEALKVFALIE